MTKVPTIQVTHAHPVAKPQSSDGQLAVKPGNPSDYLIPSVQSNSIPNDESLSSHTQLAAEYEHLGAHSGSQGASESPQSSSYANESASSGQQSSHD